MLLKDHENRHDQLGVRYCPLLGLSHYGLRRNRWSFVGVVIMQVRFGLQRLLAAAIVFFTASAVATAGALPQFAPPLDHDLTYIQTIATTGPDGTIQSVIRHRFRYLRGETGFVLESIGSTSDGKAKEWDILPLLSGGADLTIRFAVDEHGWPTRVLDWPAVKDGLQKRLTAVKPKEPSCDDGSKCNMGGLSFAVAYGNVVRKLDRGVDDRWLIGQLMPWLYAASDLPLDAVPGKIIERKGRIKQGIMSLPGKESYELVRDEREIRFNLEQTVQPESAADVVRIMSAANVGLGGGDAADMPSEQEVEEAARKMPPNVIEMFSKPTTERIAYVFDAKTGLLILVEHLHPADTHKSTEFRSEVRLERE